MVLLSAASVGGRVSTETHNKENRKLKSSFVGRNRRINTVHPFKSPATQQNTC